MKPQVILLILLLSFTLSCKNKTSLRVPNGVELSTFDGNSPSYYLYSDTPYSLKSDSYQSTATSVPVPPGIIEIAFSEGWIWGYWQPCSDNFSTELFKEEQLIEGLFVVDTTNKEIFSGMSKSSFLTRFPKLDLAKMKSCKEYLSQ